MKTPSKATILSSPTTLNKHPTSSSSKTETSISTTTTNNHGVKSPQPRFLSPTAASAARRKEILSARAQPQQHSHHHQNPLVTPPRGGSTHNKLVPSFSSPPCSSSTHSVPSKRGTLLYDPSITAPSTSASTKTCSSSSNRKKNPHTSYESIPLVLHKDSCVVEAPMINHDDDHNSSNHRARLHSPTTRTCSKGILKSPPPPPIQLIPEVYRDACTNLHTLGVCSPSASRFFSPPYSLNHAATQSLSNNTFSVRQVQQQQPFYKKQGKFGTLILQTSLSKLTKGIFLDKEEYLTIGCYKECNIRVNHRCLLKLDPDYDEHGNPCMFLCVYEGANLIKLNGEVLEGLWDDEDMDGILLKHDDEIRIVDKLLYYENYEQYERERLLLLNEVVATLPIFNDNKENIPIMTKEDVVAPSTPSKSVVSPGIKQQTSSLLPPSLAVDDNETMMSPPSKSFAKYVDTPKRKDSIQRKSISTQRKSTTPYSFHVDAINVGTLTVAANSSLLFDCCPVENNNSSSNSSLNHLSNNQRGNTSYNTSSARKSVSFGETDIQYYKPSHEPKRVSAANRLVIDDDLIALSSQTTDDSTISFGCDNDTTSHTDDLTLTQNNITSLSNICQIIHIQGDQQCTVQPVLEAGKPPATFTVLDADVDSLLEEFVIPKPHAASTKNENNSIENNENSNAMEPSQSVGRHGEDDMIETDLPNCQPEHATYEHNTAQNEDNVLHFEKMEQKDNSLETSTEQTLSVIEDEDSQDAVPTPRSVSSRGSSQRKRSTPATEESESDASTSSSTSRSSSFFLGDDDESFLNMNFYAPPMNATFERRKEEIIEHEHIELTLDDHLESNGMTECDENVATNSTEQEAALATPPRPQTAKRGRDDDSSNSSPSMRTPSCSAEKDTKKTKESDTSESDMALASSVNRVLEFELPSTYETSESSESLQTTNQMEEALASQERNHFEKAQDEGPGQTNTSDVEVVNVVLKKKPTRRRRAKQGEPSSAEDLQEPTTKPPTDSTNTSPEASVTQVPRRHRKLKK